MFSNHVVLSNFCLLYYGLDYNMFVFLVCSLFALQTVWSAGCFALTCSLRSALHCKNLDMVALHPCAVIGDHRERSPLCWASSARGHWFRWMQMGEDISSMWRTHTRHHPVGVVSAVSRPSEYLNMNKYVISIDFCDSGTSSFRIGWGGFFMMTAR